MLDVETVFLIMLNVWYYIPNSLMFIVPLYILREYFPKRLFSSNKWIKFIREAKVWNFLIIKNVLLTLQNFLRLWHTMNSLLDHWFLFPIVIIRQITYLVIIIHIKNFTLLFCVLNLFMIDKFSKRKFFIWKHLALFDI